MCSQNCGPGEETSMRKCMGNMPGQGGCVGEAERMRSCNIRPCPGWYTNSYFFLVKLECLNM